MCKYMKTHESLSRVPVTSPYADVKAFTFFIIPDYSSVNMPRHQLQMLLFFFTRVTVLHFLLTSCAMPANFLHNDWHNALTHVPFVAELHEV